MMKPPLKDLQNAIAQTIAEEEKAYDVVGMCKFFGLETGEDGNPWSSKRIYVLSLVKQQTESSLIDLAIKVQEYYKSDHLKAILNKYVGGVSGTIKNIIFAANGPKPEIVLIDAVSNDIKIVENEQYCLVYDKPILEGGLLWTDLLEWWQERQPQPFSNHRTLELSLLQRLLASLSKDSPPERLLFQTYYRHFLPKLGDNLPALIPQVYLHYDPKTIRQLALDQKDPYLTRQRMDFLLLFSNHVRIVLEVDGKQHYSVDGEAKPALYAQMVAEDRRIRLQGYEIYRFGGAELQDEQQGKAVVTAFFDTLFRQHSIKK